MPDSDFNRVANLLAATLLTGLVLALGALVVAFIVSLDLTDRQNRFAMMAERQAGAVGKIAEMAEAGVGAGTLRKALSRYRGLIAAETALLPEDPEMIQYQRREAEQAARLESLAIASAGNLAFRELTARIERQEAKEVAAAHREVDRLQARTVALAAGLASVALLCALSAAWLLVRRNRSLEAMVQARTARLEDVDRSRRLFFAKASHELRTPVTAMRGEAEVALLAANSPIEDLRQSLSHIHAQSTFLGHRIDELLGLASADEGKLQLDRSRLELGRLAEEAASEAEAYARSVEVGIELTGPPGPIPAFGDARWLRQALLTVIDNGLKFSPMGDVLSLAVSSNGSDATITIADKGPGVMPDDLPRIFDAYYQTEPGRQRGGNGLGLALARWVVEQHGGAIGAANSPGGGCCITIRLPMDASR